MFCQLAVNTLNWNWCFRLISRFDDIFGTVLTDDVVVFAFEELEAPQVGAELLELEGELDVLVGLVAVQQRPTALRHPAALELFLCDLVHTEIFDTGARALARPESGAHNVHFVPNLRVQGDAFPGHEPGKLQ